MDSSLSALPVQADKTVLDLKVDVSDVSLVVGPAAQQIFIYVPQPITNRFPNKAQMHLHAH